MTIEESYIYCRHLTLRHYENFPVASFLLQPSIRKYVFPVYAFARTADDIADESENKSDALEQLTALKDMLAGTLPDDIRTFPFFPALRDMIKRTGLPVIFLDRLLDAFIYDVNHKAFQTWEDLFHYCSLSAQPVGYIILWLHGRYKEPFIQKSNAITTALQMANFWQDISVDRKKNRIYIPLEVLREFGLTEETLFDSGRNSVKDELILFLTNATRKLMFQGKGIWKQVPIRLRYELQLTFWGGIRILERVEKLKSRVFETRPVLTTFDWMYNLFRLG